jgi:hypothetical protein
MIKMRRHSLYRMVFLGLVLAFYLMQVGRAGAEGRPRDILRRLDSEMVRRVGLAFVNDVPSQEGYPAQPQQPQPTPTTTIAQPYPLTPSDVEVAPILPELIGEDEPVMESTATSVSELNEQPINQQVANLGRYFLWGGFTAALLILAISIYGATTLFIRRKD